MIEHRVTITDSRNQSMRILIRLGPSRRGTWQALDHGYLCYQSGVACTGFYPGTTCAWISLYCYCVDKDNLILHLDNYQGFTQIQDKGEGFIYQADYLIMEPGKVRWKLGDRPDASGQYLVS